MFQAMNFWRVHLCKINIEGRRFLLQATFCIWHYLSAQNVYEFFLVCREIQVQRY